jgi:hypothetical protein
VTPRLRDQPGARGIGANHASKVPEPNTGLLNRQPIDKSTGTRHQRGVEFSLWRTILDTAIALQGLPESEFAVAKQPVKKVCHWLCQGILSTTLVRNSALAEPVAHFRIGESGVFNRLLRRCFASCRAGGTRCTRFVFCLAGRSVNPTWWPRSGANPIGSCGTRVCVARLNRIAALVGHRCRA